MWVLAIKLDAKPHYPKREIIYNLGLGTHAHNDLTSKLRIKSFSQTFLFCTVGYWWLLFKPVCSVVTVFFPFPVSIAGSCSNILDMLLFAYYYASHKSNISITG